MCLKCETGSRRFQPRAFSVIVKTNCGTDGSFYSTSLNRDSGLMGVAMDDFTLAILIWASCCCSQGLTNRNIVSAVSNFECFQSCCSARSRCCCWWSFLSTSRCWPLPPSSLHSNISNISTGKTQEQKYIPQQKHALEVSLVLQNVLSSLYFWWVFKAEKLLLAIEKSLHQLF